jgi:hypothetical protein
LQDALVDPAKSKVLVDKTKVDLKKLKETCWNDGDIEIITHFEKALGVELKG